MQMDPPCYSPIARKSVPNGGDQCHSYSLSPFIPPRYGLHVSLLERLFDHEAYNSGVGQLCKTLLTENHRSHAHVSTLLLVTVVVVTGRVVLDVHRSWKYHQNCSTRTS